jgi:hypothetical protein
MTRQDEYKDFVSKFYGYANLISKYSTDGKKLFDSIRLKSLEFDKMPEEKRIEIINNDPDFQEFQKTMNKLYSLYGSFYSFMNEGMQNPEETMPQSETKPVSAPKTDTKTTSD